jgi:putative cell wall-binding protein
MANDPSETTEPRNRAERRAAGQRRRRKTTAIAGGASILASGLALATAEVASAAEIEVTNGNNSGAGSLRQAVTDAAEGDTITFADSVSLITVTSGQIHIDEGITIDGPGSGDLTITPGPDGEGGYNYAQRLFYIAGETSVTISGVSMTDFSSGTMRGGVLYARDTDLTLDDVTMSGSSITGNRVGGALRFYSPDAAGSLTITDSMFSDNEAYQAGAISATGFGDITITDTDIVDNHAFNRGGGLYVVVHDTASVSITGGEISGNRSQIGSSAGGADVRLYGSGSLTMSDTVVSGNQANQGTGGMFVRLNDTTSGDMAGVPFGENYGRSGGLRLIAADSATAVVRETTFTANYGYYGGGAYVQGQDDGSVTIDGSTFDGNTANYHGGGLGLFAGGASTLTVVDSTVSTNDAGIGGGGVFAAGNGSGSISVMSSTISSNTTNGIGAGIQAKSDVDLVHSTVTGNVAVGRGGGVTAKSLTSYDSSYYAGHVSLDHAIVEGNTSAHDGEDDLALIDAVNSSTGIAEPATITASWSLIGDAGTTGLTSSSDSLIGADADLGPLADNGGTTLTHLPSNGSAAVEAGDPSVAGAPALDQRGHARVHGTAIDIGSVETDVVAAPPTTTPAPDGGGGAAPTTTTTRPPAADEPMVAVETASEDGTAEVVIETDAGPVTFEIQAEPGEEVTVTLQEIDPEDADVNTRGFEIDGVLYEIEVQGSTSGGGTVCFPYSGSGGGTPTIIHWTDDGERQVLDTTVVGDTVCAETTSFSPFAVVTLSTDRLAGVDAAGTAAAISADAFEPGVPVVYVAARPAVSDAIAAGAAGAPLLLVHHDSVPASTAAELERLDAARIVVVGGSSAVSDEIVAALGATRVAGVDRYETAAALAQDRFPSGGAPVAYVANGTSISDGLVAAAAAARDGGVVLLVQRDEVPAATAAALDALAPASVVVVGGTAVVSDAVTASLGATRLAGADRFATAAAIALETGGGEIAIARGDDPIDALAGSALGRPLLLVLTREIPSATEDALAALEPSDIKVLGGTAAISAQTEADVAGFMAE